MAQFTTDDGALTQLHLATSPDVLTMEGANGGFFNPIGALSAPVHPAAAEPGAADALWEATERAIAQARARALGRTRKGDE